MKITTLCIYLLFHTFIFNHYSTFVETAPANTSTDDGIFTTSGTIPASDSTGDTTENSTSSNTDQTTSGLNNDTPYSTESDPHTSSANPQTYTTAFQKSTVSIPNDRCANSSDIVLECNVNTVAMGVPVIDKFYKNAFMPACERHSICYKCGARFHKSREDCDVHFLDAMTDICEKMEGVYEKAACGGIAGIFYAHVYFSGQIQYKEQVNNDCSNIWVAICLG